MEILMAPIPITAQLNAFTNINSFSVYVISEAVIGVEL
jgi:hypothetical protein